MLDALGLDEHREAGRFLVAFDALLAEAGSLMPAWCTTWATLLSESRRFPGCVIGPIPSGA